MKTKRVILGADVAGFDLKEAVKAHLTQKGYEITDVGMLEKEHTVPFQEVGFRVGRAVSKGEFERGLLFCGSGMGIHLAAAKFPGVQCAVCESIPAAKRCVVANNCNILSMGGFYVAPYTGCQMAEEFLGSDFGDGQTERFVAFHEKAYQEIMEHNYQE